jgi:protein phosphatase 2C family protein 2/3
MDLGLYAIFDGHGGFKCAEWMEESLPSFISNTEYWKKEQYADALKQGFLDAEKAFLERAISIRDPTGTCVLMSLFHNKTKTVYIANVGDSRAVLSRGGKAIDLSRDHKADSAKELSRINQKGGRVVNGRVNGLLAVARSLGDKEMKIGKNKGPVTPYPEISKVEITSDDEFIILASDGLYDVFSSQEAVNFVHSHLQHHQDLNVIVEKLVREAASKGSEHDITTIIVALK